MTISLNEKINALGPTRRKQVEARAAELIAKEMSLRDLREAMDSGQVREGPERQGANRPSRRRGT
jgi:hypothetical protein